MRRSYARSRLEIGLAAFLVGFVLTTHSGADAAKPTTNPAAEVTSPPKQLELAPFYEKYVDANGIPIISSQKVPDDALVEARDIVLHMLSKRDDVRIAMVKNSTKVAIMARTEVTTDIPEHSDLNKVFPETDWNKRCRGIGATMQRPVSSAAEENLLAEKRDPYNGESIMVHEFAHTVLTMGVRHVDNKFSERLEATYQDAMRHGLWKNTYAATNADEYWAEGVQDWFDTNLSADPPNGIHNKIDSRDELKKYDPQLAELIELVFGEGEWRCPYGSDARSRNESAQK